MKVFESLDPLVFGQISNKMKKDKKRQKKKTAAAREAKKVATDQFNQGGRSLLGSFGDPFSGRPDSNATLLG